MKYQRLHIRIPASGKVILTLPREIKIRAEAINISAGGLCVNTSVDLLDEEEYHIEVTTGDHGIVRFSGIPAYRHDTNVGFQITDITSANLEKIQQMVEDFQLTEEFIKHIDEHDIIREWFVDDAGDDLTITFETDSEDDSHHDDSK
jgi:hypothetical protein